MNVHPSVEHYHHLDGRLVETRGLWRGLPFAVSRIRLAGLRFTPYVCGFAIEKSRRFFFLQLVY
jgi:hypothetical protein